MLPDDSIRTGRLDDAGRARIPEVTVGPVQVVQVLFQTDEPDEDNAPILAARARLKAALDAIVVQTRTDIAPKWQQWDKANCRRQAPTPTPCYHSPAFQPASPRTHAGPAVTRTAQRARTPSRAHSRTLACTLVPFSVRPRWPSPSP